MSLVKELWLIITIWAIAITLVVTFKIWLLGSLITSSVKSVSNNCGTTYGIEVIPIINGNWFCSEKIQN